MEPGQRPDVRLDDEKAAAGAGRLLRPVDLGLGAVAPGELGRRAGPALLDPCRVAGPVERDLGPAHEPGLRAVRVRRVDRLDRLARDRQLVRAERLELAE